MTIHVISVSSHVFDLMSSLPFHFTVVIKLLDIFFFISTHNILQLIHSPNYIENSKQCLLCVELKCWILFGIIFAEFLFILVQDLDLDLAAH